MNSASGDSYILRGGVVHEQSREAQMASREESLQASMQASRRLILSGFAVALAGVIAYCLSTVLAPAPAAARCVLASLAVVAIGFFGWLVGAVRYFNAAIDANDGSESPF